MIHVDDDRPVTKQELAWQIGMDIAHWLHLFEDFIRCDDLRIVIGTGEVQNFGIGNLKNRTTIAKGVPLFM
jgi:hypothetical protein